MTHVNREWTFYIPEQWFCPNFQLNRLYKLSVKKLSNTNFIASKHITEREKLSIPHPGACSGGEQTLFSALNVLASKKIVARVAGVERGRG